MTKKRECFCLTVCITVVMENIYFDKRMCQFVVLEGSRDQFLAGCRVAVNVQLLIEFEERFWEDESMYLVAWIHVIESWPMGNFEGDLRSSVNHEIKISPVWTPFRDPLVAGIYVSPLFCALPQVSTNTPAISRLLCCKMGLLAGIVVHFCSAVCS